MSHCNIYIFCCYAKQFYLSRMIFFRQNIENDFTIMTILGHAHFQNKPTELKTLSQRNMHTRTRRRVGQEESAKSKIMMLWQSNLWAFFGMFTMVGSISLTLHHPHIQTRGTQTGRVKERTAQKNP